MFKNKILNQIFKIVLAFIITCSVCWVISLFASFVADYMIEKYFVRWSLYTGFADFWFLIFCFFVSLYMLNSRIQHVSIFQIALVIVLYLFIDFALDMFDHYQGYFIDMNPNADGPYSYLIFKREVVSRLDVVHYLTKNFGTFFVYEFACFLSIISVWILSFKGRNWDII